MVKSEQPAHSICELLIGSNTLQRARTIKNIKHNAIKQKLAQPTRD